MDNMLSMENITIIVPAVLGLYVVVYFLPSLFKQERYKPLTSNGKIILSLACAIISLVAHRVLEELASLAPEVKLLTFYEPALIVSLIAGAIFAVLAACYIVQKIAGRDAYYGSSYKDCKDNDYKDNDVCNESEDK